MTSLYAISFIIWALIAFPNKTETQMYEKKKRADFLDEINLFRIHSIIICIESCLFGLFVIAIFADQIQSIRNDRSLIDALKMDEATRTSSQVLPPAKILFRKVFGPGKNSINNRSINLRSLLIGPMILWLLPCDLKTSSSNLDPHNLYHV